MQSVFCNQSTSHHFKPRHSLIRRGHLNGAKQSRVEVSLELVCKKTRADCASLRHQYGLAYPVYVAFYLLRKDDRRGYPNIRSVISVWDVTGNTGFDTHQIYAVVDLNAVLARWISEHPSEDEDVY